MKTLLAILTLLILAAPSQAGRVWCEMCQRWEYRPGLPDGTVIYKGYWDRQTTPVVRQPAPTKNPVAPTPQVAVDVILATLKPTTDDTFVDLGCGDGRVVKAAAEYCRAVGVELDRTLAQTAYRNCQGKATILNADALTVDIGDATIVYVYHYPELLAKLAPRLKVVPVVVSYLHEIPGLEAAEVIEWEHEGQTHCWYVYQRDTR